MVYKSLIRPRSFLGKLRTSCEVSFISISSSVQNMVAYVMHIIIIMHSRIWFELSDQGTTPPHVTRKVAQNTRPSFSHVQEGLGMRPMGNQKMELEWKLWTETKTSNRIGNRNNTRVIFPFPVLPSSFHFLFPFPVSFHFRFPLDFHFLIFHTPLEIILRN